MKKIFVTGISGCVGHYLFDELSAEPDYHLYLLVRDPARLRFNYKNNARVTVVTGDLENIGRHAGLIKEMDFIVHAAADWGAHENNLDHSIDFFNLIDPARCRKVIYISTASILGPDNKPVPEAATLGTHYIRGKYLFHKILPDLPVYPKVITLFPTWVLGGDTAHPYSHATAGILGIRSWLWLIRFFKVDAGFHYIHARDIARVIKHLLKNEAEEKEFVLGNPAVTAGRLIEAICNYFGWRVYFQLPISLPLAVFLAQVTGHKLHPWDLYCFKRRNFVCQAVNAANFGLPSGLTTVRQVLADAEGRS
ncbi:MAG: NAD(P)-dependent oxidoreductase [Candidatus Saganbacteria bacterium]|nr:NAD(P)-dependent oxidoreductase [Candidatus Saganbacteria bacterium]